MSQRERELDQIKTYVRRLFSNDPTGHDYFHMKRVAHQAVVIAEEEEANQFICEAASWLHDVYDSKLVANPVTAKQDMIEFLTSIHIPEKEISLIHEVIDSVSFSKGEVPVSLEAKVVQDADRLDAIGAVGIARTFAYGGAAGQLIYHPEDKNTSLQHFYDKLLKLKSMLNTEAAIEIAADRHHFMEIFLNQFYKEW
ncbi:metal-dependent phosphohydrolase [Virgibacillus halodenitrificans]|uniref:Metal-dependent phosphohydrolase n=1 Tax=Virgibacillus halodenitrificans TaxID=1482 RepID=A0AAC9J0P9_VIRHA|nr:HD domain-containing protein [Virgibacillus halodenitrificans]APC48483.1 metal-dependent phosphohydrolase [Virgibacillus halodenitrificans]